MRYRAYERRGIHGLAVRWHDGWRDLGSIALVDLLRAGRIGDPDVGSSAPLLELDQVILLPPLPQPGKIVCVGLNYVDHAAESPYKELPKYPCFFPRYASSLVASGAPIIRPRVSGELDFEGELVAVVGRKARHVDVASALDYVAGYSIFNDGSIRDYQFLALQWTPGKNFDGTGAFGPEFVSADEVPEGARTLQLQVYLNGELMQSANTSDMIFSVAELVARASEFMTLEPGDIIVTGTPAGVGFARRPQRFMKHGDIVEVRIDGIGSLTNPVQDE